MIVLFYNAENLFDTLDDPRTKGDEEFTPDGEKFWDEDRLQEKLLHLSKAITLLHNELPAIIGLAEVENRSVLEMLIQTTHLKNGNYKIIHYESDDPRGIDCALLYNPTVFSLIRADKHILHVTDEPDFRTRDILEVHGKLNGAEVTFFVNHWPSRKEGVRQTEHRRRCAAQLLRKRVDEILHFDRLSNILIMGDFNDTPDDDSLHGILRAKGQHELAKNDLINLLIEEEHHGLGTHVHQGEWMVFDQLIVSQALLQGRNGLSVLKNNAFIFKNKELLFTYPNGNTKPNASYSGDTYHGGYSDHLPVFVRLERK